MFVCVCWCFNISICCISGNVVKKVVVCFKISESLSRAKTIYTSKKVVKFLCCFLYWVVVCVCGCVTKKLGWKFFTFFLVGYFKLFLVSGFFKSKTLNHHSWASLVTQFTKRDVWRWWWSGGGVWGWRIEMDLDGWIEFFFGVKLCFLVLGSRIFTRFREELLLCYNC